MGSSIVSYVRQDWTSLVDYISITWNVKVSKVSGQSRKICLLRKHNHQQGQPRKICLPFFIIIICSIWSQRYNTPLWCATVRHSSAHTIVSWKFWSLISKLTLILSIACTNSTQCKVFKPIRDILFSLQINEIIIYIILR